MPSLPIPDATHLFCSSSYRWQAKSVCSPSSRLIISLLKVSPEGWQSGARGAHNASVPHHLLAAAASTFRIQGVECSYALRKVAESASNRAPTSLLTRHELALLQPEDGAEGA